MKKIAYKKQKNKFDSSSQKSSQKKVQRKKLMTNREVKNTVLPPKSTSAPMDKSNLTAFTTENSETPTRNVDSATLMSNSKNHAKNTTLSDTNDVVTQPPNVPLAHTLAKKVLEEKSVNANTQKKSDADEKEKSRNVPQKLVKKTKENKDPKHKFPLKASMLYNRKAFYFYISIFVCMLVIESYRFSMYFEEASSKYPVLAHVGETIEDVARVSGISALMDTVGEFIAELSEEQTYDAEKPFDEQWETVIEHYKNIFGIHSLSDMLGEKAVEDTKTETNDEAARDAAEEAKADLDDDTQKPAPPSSQQTAEKDIKTQNTHKAPDVTVVQKERTPGFVSIFDPSALQKKDPALKPQTDSKKDGISTPTQPAEHDAQQKQTESPAKVESKEKAESKKQAEGDKKQQQIIAPSPVPAQKVPQSTPVRYAFYEPQNLVAAPTKMALEEYTTYLPDLGQKKKILLVGDSMMQGLVPLIQTALKHRKDLEIVHRVKVSTGLSNQRFFHWPDNLKKLLKQHNPHVVIVFIGANDPQDLIVDKKWYKVSSDAWEEVYSMRTINFLELATSENRKVVWIGLPIMLKEPYANNIKRINKVFKEVNSFYPAAAFVDTHMLLTDKGKFISFITGKNNKTIRVRAKDNIHLTFAGGRLITNYMIPTLNDKVGAARLDDVGGNPLIPVAGKANTITFTSNIQKKKVEYIAYLPNLHPRQSPKIPNEPVANSTQKTTTDWQPFVSTAQATVVEQNSPVEQNTAPASIVAIQDNAENPPPVEKLIAQSLQKKNEQKKNTNFPVLYLLHGASGNGRDWNTHMGKELQKIADEKRVIIVAPTAGKYNWYVNSPLQKNSQMENFVVKELVPHVDTLLPSNGKRAIAGLSMGGHGALLLSLKYPKTFHSTASASGVLDIRLHPEKWNINKVLGNYAKNKQTWNKNSVAYVLERKHSKNIPQQILISTGLQDDMVLQDNQNIHKLLAKKKFKFEYEEVQGSHDWKFWKSQFSKLLRKQADFLNL